MMANRPNDLETLPPAMSPGTLLALLSAVIAGALGAVVFLPAFLPGLTQSLLGNEPKAYWFLARASAFVAFGLLWLSTVLGLLITNKLARIWPGGPVAFDLHQHASLLALAMALFHALILLGDRYINYTLIQLAVPFASTGYEPVWVGAGQLGLYALTAVSLSFYVRRRITHRMWRLIHFLSFAVFAMVMAHGIQSGSDSGSAWAQAMYWFAGASVVFLTVYRVLSKRVK
jgi:predicted ferric reductase